MAQKTQLHRIYFLTVSLGLRGPRNSFAVINILNKKEQFFIHLYIDIWLTNRTRAIITRSWFETALDNKPD